MDRPDLTLCFIVTPFIVVGFRRGVPDNGRMAKREQMPLSQKLEAPTGIATLLRSTGDSLKTTRKSWEERELNKAPRFASFSFFSAREAAVSKMIAALMDPHGLHGQGRSFLDLLIQRIGSDKLNNLVDRKVAVRSVNVEEPTKDRRRIDIVVSFEDGFNIGIENKVFGAAEQHDQIAHYVEELATRGKFVLLFLTDEIGSCTSISESEQKRLVAEKALFIEPAKNFILSWLEACSQRHVCKADNVRQFLSDFAKYIRCPPEETFMASSEVKNSVVDRILTSPEALASASAIRDHFESAIQTVLDQFLEALYTKLKSLLAASDMRSSWGMTRHTEFWGEKKACPVHTPHPEKFIEGFNRELWKYVGLTMGDKVSVVLEMGFKDPTTRHHFGVTVGVHKTGSYELYDSDWGNKSALTAKQDLSLQKRLEHFDHPDSGLLHDEHDVYPGWYWHRYLNNSVFALLHPETGAITNDGVVRFYSTLHNPNDTTIDDLAAFMLKLCAEVASSLGK